MDSVIEFDIYRRFGVEIELNTFDGEIRKLDRSKGEIPFGSDHIALIIKKTIRQSVEIQGWDHNFNNDYWIVKPDSSCGIEVCTPVLKGNYGLYNLTRVIEAFKKHKISSDQRCSLHVHVNISDLNKEQLASVIAWYIKCENVFMDSVPSIRKVNRYCQMIGLNESLNTDFSMNCDDIIKTVSHIKYHSLNAYHFMKGGGFDEHNNRKKTIEFRIGENAMCLDGFAVKNWIRLLLHFVETTKSMPLPKRYSEGDPYTGLLWLDPSHVFKILNFDKPCSNGMLQVKNWFIKRIFENGFNTNLLGIWSNDARLHARKNFLNLLHKIDTNDDSSQSRDDLIYGKKYSK
jgi:hypothetical protein